MGVWWQRGRRGGRLSRRLFGHFLETRYGAAEGVLSAVAVMLVVWLLWPEEHGPALDQRASWQRSVKEAERRRVELEGERAAKSAFDKLRSETESETASEKPTADAVPQRRRIAKPSDLADRLDNFGRRPGQLAASQSFQPAPRRPGSDAEPAIDVGLLRQGEVAETSGKKTEGEVTPSSVASAETTLVDGINQLKADDAADAADSAEDGFVEEPSLEVAVLSSEALDAEPLPQVDLSDLDVLVPEEEDAAERTTLAEVDPLAIDDAAITPSPDDAIGPFVIEPDPTTPSNDVSERPRDDAPTWLKNAVTAGIDDDRPVIAVVIDDLGLNRSNTAALNDLPSPLTLAFLPYAGRIEAQTEAAQVAGHELMLHLPMEPLGSDWPGPDALTTKIGQDEFTARLVKNLDRFEGFVGINNHMGSRLTADSSRMDVVMRELRKRDVLFLDSKTSARSVASDIAGQNGVPNTTRDIFLDHVIDIGAIKRQLTRAERIARQNGSAVAIGHPHSATIQALREWLPTLKSRGLALAPISAVVARRACSKGVLIAADTCGRYLQARTPSEAALAAKGG